MGFIQQTGVTTLTAYLTQRGRQYLVDGNKVDLQVRYFTLNDPDVNYLVASEPTNVGFNIVANGFIPDLSGSGDGLLSTVAGGVGQSRTLQGGNAIGLIGTDGELNTPINSAFFPNTTQAVLLNKRTTGFQQLSFDVPVSIATDSGLTGKEGVKVFMLPPSQGTSVDLYRASSVNGTIAWGASDVLRKTATVNINLNKPVGSYSGVIKLKIVPNRCILDIAKGSDILTVRVRVDITRATAGGSVATSGGAGGSSTFSLGFPNI